ncbi:PepSY domain-containing protein [Shinella oryzae]|uniref:PepSY domain-containing protein n=1 Tax=Shinella oryzae TaxID=2871820 RepID=UPI001FF10D90|nr:PepSY domain-containing protein [Shinella oryzae]UPA25627.1 PepSY domain-containing protein [Shinella oryzae]
MKRAVILIGLLAAFPAAAQEVNKPTPETGKKPSEILAMIEQRPGFDRLEEMSWEDEGYYEIVYHTTDKARVEVNIDPMGKAVEHR